MSAIAQLDEGVGAERDQLERSLRVVGEAREEEVHDGPADGDGEGAAAQPQRKRAGEIDQHDDVVEPAVQAHADQREQHGDG